MTWADFYLLCFLVGFLLSAVSFLAAGLPGHGSHGGNGGGGNGSGGGAQWFGRGPAGQEHGVHAHVHAHSHPHSGEASFSFFNLATGSAFLAWFGGTGFLLARYSSMWVWAALVLAVGCGLAGAAAVFLFVARFLLRHEKNLDPADYDMVGVLGRVSSPIREGGIGEMIFSRGGGRQMSPARSEDGQAIPRDTEVVVTRYEGGIAFVRRWDELMNQ